MTFGAPLRRQLPLDVEQRWEYDGSGLQIYYGFAQPEAAEDSDVWVIEKTTYNGNGFRTKTEIKKGVAWDDRASLDWD